MDASILVVIAIFVAIVLGYITRINTGLFAMSFAYLIGCFVLNMKAKEVIQTWPISIFYVIFSVSLFYNFAMVNGTLEKLAMILLYHSRKFPKFLPLIIYLAASLVAALGAGFFTVLAFFAPITLILCDKTGTSKLIGAIAVNYGALSGANFMTSASGIIFRGLMSDVGYQEQAFKFSSSIFITSFVLPILVILALILVFERKKTNANFEIEKPEPFNKVQKMNMLLMIAMIVIVLAFPIMNTLIPGTEVIKFINSKLDIGLIAIIFSVISLMLKLGDQKEVIARIPWNTLIMICGVGMLIQVAIKAGTIDNLANWVGSNIPPFVVPFALGIIGAFMSFFSSTLGVVCPALFPVIPSIALATGLNPALLFTATVIGSQSSAISPFSSGGSLILGSLQEEQERGKLFNSLFFKAIPICFGAAIFGILVLRVVL